MSKTLVSVLVVGVVLVGGYFVFSKKGGEKIAQQENTNSEVKEETTGKKMAFSQFVKQGGSYKCDVRQAMSDFENSGTVYISGSNISGEFNTIAEGRPMSTSFMMSGGYSYTWSSALPNMGFKIKTNTNNESANISGNYSWNAEQIGDYNCEPWTADQSKFVIPTSIKFQEMSTTSAQ